MPHNRKKNSKKFGNRGPKKKGGVRRGRKDDDGQVFRTSGEKKTGSYYKNKYGRRNDPAEISSSEAAESVPGFIKAVNETKQQIEAWLEQAKKIQATPYVPPERPFDELDPWQQEAVDLLNEGQNVIVDAPTTAGKTRVVEAFMALNIENPSFRACYTCPVKSLSNDKLKEFRELFGEEKVGISTGDIKENLGAPIVVATLESYRNSLLGVEPDLDRSLVIFDEYHYIQEASRGSAWEEAIILSPTQCQLLLLSASLSNAPAFATWIEEIKHKPTKVVSVEKRPVPLADLVYYAGEFILAEKLPKQALKFTKKEKPRPLKHTLIAKRLAKVVELGLSPTIIYTGRRLSCKLLAEEVASSVDPLDETSASRIAEELSKCHERYKALSYMDQTFRRMIQRYGVAYHHSGLQPPVRMTVEALVKKGLLRFCTATMGMSLGINFSVRSTMISDFDRPGELGAAEYGPSEILQMLGRAGRRGKDPIGYSLWPTPTSYLKMGGARREDIYSRLKNDPTTFLGLVGRGFTLRQIEDFYKKSFQRYQDKEINLSLINSGQLRKKLAVKKIPCGESPANAFAHYLQSSTGPCTDCAHKKLCHDSLKGKLTGSLARLHLHLHKIEALDHEEKLTSFGSLARYFPHSGGLYVARMISSGSFTEENLGELVEVMASLSLARFKEPSGAESYRFVRDPKKMEKKLEKLYPLELFEDLYDPPFGRRNYFVLREFNPAAGAILRKWLRGTDWNELVSATATKHFGAGDISATIYRVASYLQALAASGKETINSGASQIRADILRSPLDYTL